MSRVVRAANEPAGPATQTSGRIRCDKCAAEMAPTRVRRFSGGIVAIGYLLMILGLLPILGSAACGILSTGSVVRQSAKGLGDERDRTIDALNQISGLPPSVVDEYRASGRISDATINALPHDQQFPVRMAIAGDVGGKAGTALASGLTAGVSSVLLRARSGDRVADRAGRTIAYSAQKCVAMPELSLHLRSSLDSHSNKPAAAEA
jgi:hypothetical protein